MGISFSEYINRMRIEYASMLIAQHPEKSLSEIAEQSGFTSSTSFYRNFKLYKDMGKAYVSVKDYGETIPADDLPFIFDRFHKSDRSRSLDKEGVGLGLYLVKTIINAHDEDIAVRSEDGMTEFVFTLTLAENMK